MMGRNTTIFAEPACFSLLTPLTLPAFVHLRACCRTGAGGGMQYGEAAYMPVLPMGAGGGHGGQGGAGLQMSQMGQMGQMSQMGQMGTSEDFAMSASHRLIQAAGGGRGPMRPKNWLG